MRGKLAATSTNVQLHWAAYQSQCLQSVSPRMAYCPVQGRSLSAYSMSVLGWPTAQCRGGVSVPTVCQS